MTADARIHAAQGLFAETPDGPRLLGSRCRGCDVPCFPRASACRNPDCTEGRMEDASFGPRGTLWSFAIQNYPPPPPALHEEPYTPYAIGIVDFAEGLRVVGRMHVETPEKLELGWGGAPTFAPRGRHAEGREIVTWMFEPV
jgi:uncharacterized protein